MSCLKAWNKRQHKTHDDNVDALLTDGEEVIGHAKALSDSIAKIASHMEKIAEAAGTRQSAAKKESDRRLHVMIADMERLGKNIFKISPRDMAQAEIKKHRDHASAIVPLLRELAEHATALARYWTQAHKRMAAVANLFGK